MFLVYLICIFEGGIMFQRPFELAQDNPEFLKALERQKELFDFYRSIRFADKEEIEKHIQQIGDVNELCWFSEYPPLMIAAEKNDLDLMKFLVEKGCNVNAFCCGNFGLYEIGMQLSDRRIFEFLKEQKTLPFDELKETTLKLCELSSEGKVEAFNQIVRDKFNNQITPIVALTMADRAVRWNNSKPIELLHQRGVKYHLITYMKKHHTLLHFASNFLADKVVYRLLQQGFNPNILNYKKQTPLLLASQCSDAKPVMQHLIDFGANINAIDFQGKTAAHRAVEKNQVENLKFLIKNGVDLNIQDFSGSTALHLAQHQENKELIHVIETATKKPSLIQKSTVLKPASHQSHQRGDN